MNRSGRAVIAAAVAALLHAAAAAQASGPYRMEPATVGGGGVSTGDAYRLVGTPGQPATAKLSATRYALCGGWLASACGVDRIFADGFDP